MAQVVEQVVCQRLVDRLLAPPDILGQDNERQVAPDPSFTVFVCV